MCSGYVERSSAKYRLYAWADVMSFQTGKLGWTHDGKRWNMREPTGNNMWQAGVRKLKKQVKAYAHSSRGPNTKLASVAAG
jgi:hypothetical protein